MQTLKPRSGCEAICLPTSSKAASLTDIAESQNLPSTASCTRLSPKTSGSASTIILTCSLIQIKHKYGLKYSAMLNNKQIKRKKGKSSTARKALALITGEFSLKLA